MSLNAYLARSHSRVQSRNLLAAESLHIVLGNEAADPDSCVCAIAMAAALDAINDNEKIVIAPLILVPRADFKLQLDRVHLLRRAGLVGDGEGPAWTPSHVCFGDELDLKALAARGAPSLYLHLVDHNKLSASLADLGPHVSSIVDHHAEEGLYTETVPADNEGCNEGPTASPSTPPAARSRGTAQRLVELGIGSCASLVAERLKALVPALLADASISAVSHAAAQTLN